MGNCCRRQHRAVAQPKHSDVVYDDYTYLYSNDINHIDNYTPYRRRRVGDT